MVAPEDLRLCEHLLAALYGHACAELGSLLLARGRLPFAGLLKLSALTAPSVRAALVTLIQHNCVCHSETGTAKTSVEYFEAVPEEILSRLRFGKYISLAEDIFGFESKIIIECLLENGKLRIHQLISQVLSTYYPDDQDPNRRKILKSNLLNLLSEKFIKPSNPNHSITTLDLHLSWEQQMIGEIQGIPTPKDLRNVKDKLIDKISKQENEEFEELCSFDLRKRKLAVESSGNGNSSKRSKVEEVLLNDDMFVRVNYDRFNIKIRNSIFEQECLRSFNQESSKVIKSMLTLSDPKQRDCQDLISGPISCQSIVIKLGEESKSLKSSFPLKSSNGKFILKLKNTGDITSEILSILSKQDDLSISSSTSGSVFLNGSLNKLLTQINPIPIVSEKKGNNGNGANGSGGMREFVVEFGRYSVELRKCLVIRIVKEKFGVEAGRIVRILLVKGKLDENHVAKYAMMTLANTRETCHILTTHNILEIQEISKSNNASSNTRDREIRKTFFLFFIDFKKLILNLTSKLRKSQINCIERILFEVSKSKTLLSKINRKDVFHQLNGDGEDFLNVWEKNELDGLKIKIEALEIAKMRLERDVFILRDLPWVG